MNDMNRIVVFVLIVGILFGLYKYQQHEEKKNIKPTKNRSNKTIQKKQQEQEDNTVIEDSQTLGSLVDAESFQTHDSGDSMDSLFN